MLSNGSGSTGRPPANCGNCVFFVMSPDNVTGNCHEGPPMAVHVPGGVDPETKRQIGPGWNSIWPPVSPSGWCGRHPWLRGLVESTVTKEGLDDERSEHAG
jgi:hypothetical protein